MLTGQTPVLLLLLKLESNYKGLLRVQIHSLAERTQAAGSSDSETEKERRECKRDDVRSTIPRLNLTVVMYPNHQDFACSGVQDNQDGCFFFSCLVCSLTHLFVCSRNLPTDPSRTSIPSTRPPPHPQHPSAAHANTTTRYLTLQIKSAAAGHPMMEDKYSQINKP